MSYSVLGNGIYSYSQAARLIRANPSRVSAWFRGRNTGRGPALRSDYAKKASLTNAISFLDLVEALVALKLREHNVSLITIRKTHAELSDILNSPHPFAHKGLYTDGKKVFVHIAEKSENEQLIDAINRQHVFTKFILPYLKLIDFSSTTKLAKRWHIVEGVIIDPARRYGKPIVESSGMPTSILAAAYHANNQDLEFIADCYGIPPDDVQISVEFEAEFSSKVA